MDKTAIFHDRASGHRLVIPHDTYVHSVLPIPSEMSSRNLIVTGSDDEKIRVWEANDDLAKAEMVSVVEAHSGPVNNIKLTKLQVEGSSVPQWRIVTGSLDGTLRRWALDG